jgi:hypothetical protein
MVAPLSIAGVDGRRTLVAFRRRRGLLPVLYLKPPSF